MARPRKTIDELKRSGTYRPSRHGTRETRETPSNLPSAGFTRPEALEALPVRPADLSPAAITIWDALIVALAGQVTSADGPMLAEAVRWLEDLSRCRAAMATAAVGGLEHGRLMRSSTSAAAAADKLLARFGLTPRDRAKLPQAAPSPGTARVPTRGKDYLDLATEAWHAAGHTGPPSEAIIARFRDAADAAMMPDERAKRAKQNADLKAWQAERAALEADIKRSPSCPA